MRSPLNPWLDIRNLTDHSEWKKYPVIICECTGYPEIKHHPDYDRPLKKRTHTHLPELIPIMKEHTDKQWVLIHASTSISNKDLLQYQTSLREEGINITILI